MRIEIRSDGAHISGYVNATEKKSRPVITPRGKVIEVIEPRAFERALARAGDIALTLDHNSAHVYASTNAGTLQLYEDDIGLHADVLIEDADIIELARKGKIRGWSFGMYNVQDSLESRADELPIRHIKDLDLDHVTLVANQIPCYSATSVEVRAEKEVEVETRSTLGMVQMTDVKRPFFDNSEYKKRIESLKKQKGKETNE